MKTLRYSDALNVLDSEHWTYGMDRTLQRNLRLFVFVMTLQNS